MAGRGSNQKARAEQRPGCSDARQAGVQAASSDKGSEFRPGSDPHASRCRAQPSLPAPGGGTACLTCRWAGRPPRSDTAAAVRISSSVASPSLQPGRQARRGGMHEVRTPRRNCLDWQRHRRQAAHAQAIGQRRQGHCRLLSAASRRPPSAHLLPHGGVQKAVTRRGLRRGSLQHGLRAGPGLARRLPLREICMQRYQQLCSPSSMGPTRRWRRWPTRQSAAVAAFA